MSPAERIVFNPSLIWLPSGKRKAEDLTFPVEPTFARRGIDFMRSVAVEIDAERKRVRAADGQWHGDGYLVIATDYRSKMDAVSRLR